MPADKEKSPTAGPHFVALLRPKAGVDLRRPVSVAFIGRAVGGRSTPFNDYTAYEAVDILKDRELIQTPIKLALRHVEPVDQSTTRPKETSMAYLERIRDAILSKNDIPTEGSHTPLELTDDVEQTVTALTTIHAQFEATQWADDPMAKRRRYGLIAVSAMAYPYDEIKEQFNEVLPLGEFNPAAGIGLSALRLGRTHPLRADAA